MGQNRLKSGGKPWPEWSKTLGRTPMPTQSGQAPDRVSMSGGWTWSTAAKSQNPDLAWKFIETLQTRENAVEYDVVGAQVAVRKDVAADPRYLRSMPGSTFSTGLVEHTHYRPALPVHPQVSTAIGESMEAVTTGDATAAEAVNEGHDGR